MTLAQAGTTLERFGKNRENSLPDDVCEAIETVTALLPRIPELPPIQRRYDELRDSVKQVSGIDIKDKKRDAVTVIWRRCVWYMLFKEGYSLSDIGRVSGFNHATVIVGLRRHADYMQTNDYQTRKIWNVFSTIILNG